MPRIELRSHLCLLIRRLAAIYERDYLSLKEEYDDELLVADQAEQLVISFAASPSTLKVFDRGRGLLFKDFRQLVDSPGFVALVRSLGRFALVISLVERVSRKGNVGIAKTVSSKQRDNAQDEVVTDLHIGMVSFDFCPGN